GRKAGLVDRRRGAGPRHRDRAGPAGFRPPDAAADRADDCSRGRAAPGRRAVSRGQHGPEDPRRRPVPAQRRQARGPHHAGAGRRGAGAGARGRAPRRYHDRALQHHGGSSLMPAELRLFKDAYVDSVVQLSGTRAMYAVDGVRWAAAAMGTPTNLETLRSEGFQPPDAGANDLFVAASAEDDDAVEHALDAAEHAIFAARKPADTSGPADAKTLREAVQQQPGSNVAVISVPGEYAPLEAHKALSAGLDVLLFSDNVPVDAEIELKDRARQLGRLVMGPGAGTAMLAGTGLGFANVVATGRVGVVAAAGTGAQEAM